MARRPANAEPGPAAIAHRYDRREIRPHGLLADQADRSRERGSPSQTPVANGASPTRSIGLALCTLIIVAMITPASVAATLDPDPLPRVRAWYFDAVEREAAIDPAIDSIARLRGSPAVSGRPELDLVLWAYEGALVTLRAKHGFWPTTRLQHLREGLDILDRAVAAAPDQAEIRYLRLMSCFYLPRILGRGDSVRDDLAALARLLPDVRDRYDPELWEAIASFVLEHAELTAAQRAELEAAMHHAPR